MWTLESHFSPALWPEIRSEEHGRTWDNGKVSTESERERERAHLHCISVLFLDVDDVTNPRFLQVFPIPSYIPLVSHLSPLTFIHFWRIMVIKTHTRTHTLNHISPCQLTFNHREPLIGLVNQIQMIRDQASCPVMVWFIVWPVGEAVDHSIETLPVTSQLILQVRGQQTKSLVKAFLQAWQDLTD